MIGWTATLLCAAVAAPQGLRLVAAQQRYAAGRQSQREHHVGADGMLTTNRRGRKLCQKWQECQCEPSVQGSCVCPRDLGAVHRPLFVDWPRG